MTDGNLRKLFQRNLPEAHWQAVESFSTGQGMPDANYCFPGGAEGWIENKATSGWTVDISPHQVAWHERRARMGGRTFIAVRRQALAGPRRGAATDELWLFQGSQTRELAQNGLKGPNPLGIFKGGPSNWDWLFIKFTLSAFKRKK